MQQQEMLDHDILSREEELRYGRRVVKARELRERIDILLGERRDDGTPRRWEWEGGGADHDFPCRELAFFSPDGPQPPPDGARRRRPGRAAVYTSLRRVPLDRLTDADAIALGVPGGKAALVEILRAGARARETLMRQNVKLVMSIAKRWLLRSYSTAGTNPVDGDVGGDDRSDRQTKARQYEGSWDRPSLDEVLQEGALGLARAADGYDPERGLRFSTYATHWITSHVRTCFQRASTGCLRVPGQLHDLRAKHATIVREHLHAGIAPPERGTIAAELGVSEGRLVTALRSTQGLLSLDAPLAGGKHKGSGAGGDGSNQELLVLDTLKCAEPCPEDLVDRSLLRQCLEHAMATELTPYERDVVRLRLGLDRGSTMTVRQIAALSGGSASMADIRGAERRAFRKLRCPGSVHAPRLRAHADLAAGAVCG